MDAIEEAIIPVERSGFYQWDDLDYYNEVEGGEEFFSTTGTIQCAGGIRIQVTEKCRFDRETRWSPRGQNRKLRLIEYSYSAILNNRGNIFRYDSPDLVQDAATPDHHKDNHCHRFNVLGTGEEIKPPRSLAPKDVPTLREVLEEAERWHYDHLDK